VAVTPLAYVVDPIYSQHPNKVYYAINKPVKIEKVIVAQVIKVLKQEMNYSSVKNSLL